MVLSSQDISILGIGLLAYVAMLAGFLWICRDWWLPRGKIARVSRVLDGNTAVVSTGFRTLTLRLASIDCPETGQPWGDTARRGLVKLIGGERILVKIYARNADSSYLATVWVRCPGEREWTNVNASMVEQGHAWVFHEDTHHLSLEHYRELARLERRAMRQRIGLWSNDKPIPPWEWRQLAA